jgi:hypothetical protein
MLEAFIDQKVVVQFKSGEKFIAVRSDSRGTLAMLPMPGPEGEVNPVILPFVIGTVRRVFGESGTASFVLEYEEPDLLNGQGNTTHRYRTAIGADVIATITSAERKAISIIGM